jgi:hypothetical protein
VACNGTEKKNGDEQEAKAETNPSGCHGLESSPNAFFTRDFHPGLGGGIKHESIGFFRQNPETKSDTRS